MSSASVSSINNEGPRQYQEDPKYHGFLKDFIVTYRSNPCLWNSRSPEYMDKSVKSFAYDKLVRIMLKFDPTATRSTVLKKINSLRTSFRREYRRVQEMKEQGRNYQPSLWYYPHLLFLSDMPTTNECPGSDTNEEQSYIKEEPNINAEYQYFMDEIDHAIPDEEHDNAEPSQSNKRLRIEEPEEFKQMDEFDHFGKYISLKLRKLDPRQSIFAQHFIGQIMLFAELDTLSVRTTINTNNDSDK